MKQFYVEIVTTEGKAFEGNAEKLVLPTTEGPVCIMGGHIDYFAKAERGEVRLVCDGKERRGDCLGGVVSVNGGQVSLVTVKFEWK